MEKKSLFDRTRSYLKGDKVYSGYEIFFRNILYRKRFFARFNHNIKSFEFKSAHTAAPKTTFDDSQLTERLKKLYIICDTSFDGNKNSMWSGIFNQLQGDIHSAFVNEEEEKVRDILRVPKNYNLFYGFENLCRDLLKVKRLEDTFYPEMAMDSLLSLCEAVGVISISNPETLRTVKALDPDQAIVLLEKEFGFELSFPNPFEGEYGIRTKRGIASYRAVQAIYQAWKISKIVSNMASPVIAEIGGGLGRTAYYCRFFGILDYTIVDIPISSVAQGNFLGRSIPVNELEFYGEPGAAEEKNPKIKLIPPKVFFSSERKYDLIINIDSLSELDINIAKDYLLKIKTVSDLFFSINHENNSFSINSISKDISGLKRLYRNASWIRRGYVEELFEKM